MPKREVGQFIYLPEHDNSDKKSVALIIKKFKDPNGEAITQVVFGTNRNVKDWNARQKWGYTNAQLDEQAAVKGTHDHRHLRSFGSTGTMCATQNSRRLVNICERVEIEFPANTTRVTKFVTHEKGVK